MIGRLARRAVTLVALALPPAPTGAQPPASAPPGPYSIDIRGVTSGLPTAGFYPPVPAGTAAPARGLGVDVGGHIYLFTLGDTRVGVGATYLRARGTADAPRVQATPSSSPSPMPAVASPDVAADLRVVSPQVSFNFGTSAGWSYLSAGIGSARVRTEARAGTIVVRESGGLATLNAGGGARWFFREHVAFGFDIRLFRLGGRPGASATPTVTLVAVSAGVSFR